MQSIGHTGKPAEALLMLEFSVTTQSKILPWVKEEVPRGLCLERAAMRYCGIGKSGFDSALANAKNLLGEYNITEPFIKMLPTNMGASIGLAQLTG